jgi:hypothetical protein
MSKSRDPDFSEVIVRCAIYAFQSVTIASKGGHYEKLKESLSLALGALSQIQKISTQGWEVDQNNPGFLLKQSGFAFVRLPAHLVQLFPDDESLERIWELGVRIKTTESSIIYISGSYVCKGVLYLVNDIDFFEYTTTALDELSESIAKLAIDISDRRLCTRIKIANGEFITPFHLNDIKLKVASLDHQDANNCSFKMDYILSADWTRRPYEVSNIGIVCRINEGVLESAGFHKTFMYQQAQLAATDLIPKRLDDPGEMGRYALFLLNEVNKHKKSDNVLKMLKRLLSLVRFFYFRDLTERFEKLLDNSTILVKAELEEITRIKCTLQNLDDGKKAFLEENKVIEEMDQYEKELTLQYEMDSMKEKIHYPRGVSLEVFDLLQSTAKVLHQVSGGSLKI